MMKKTIALMLSLILVISTATAVYGTGYADVKTNNWAYEAINAMSDKTIVKGYPDGSFKPNSTVTYGEFIKMALIAATGEDVGNASKPDHWARNYYNKALELKYFTGHDISQAQLGNQITRGDMALIISAILGDVKIENYDEIQKGISDVTYQTEHEYDITKAYATGVLTGYTDNTFKPDKTLTRAESAMVIYRLVDESKREMPETEKKEKPIEKKVTISYPNWDKSFEYTLKTAKSGDSYGIIKFSITKQGYIAIYSTVKYESISLVIDNKITSSFVNPNGTSYWLEDGYYVYYAEPKKDGINVKGKIPMVLVSTFSQGEGSNSELLELADMTL